MSNVDYEMIRSVIEESYIGGIHGIQDEQLVKRGFHDDFRMLVLHDDVIDKVSVDEWLAKVERMKLENPQMWSSKTAHSFELVDVSGYAAVAKVDVHKGAVHFSTDYMLLYKFSEGWKIVSKVFAIPQ